MSSVKKKSKTTKPVSKPVVTAKVNNKLKSQTMTQSKVGKAKKPLATKTALKKEPKPQAVKIPKLVAPKTPFKQSEFFKVLVEQTNLSKNQIHLVFEKIKAFAKVHLLKNGPGQFTVPGMLKITQVTKPATKARPGRNPFTGEEMTIQAKPARKVIRVKALKKFKSELE